MKKQKMKFTFTQVRLIKMSKKQFVGFRAGRPGFLLGGVIGAPVFEKVTVI